MAEAFFKQLATTEFNAESAGLEPGTLNPLAVEAMQEIGIDISKNKTKDVFDFFKQDRHFNYVVTVCDEASAEKCPFFPSQKEKINWSFADPSAFRGTHDEKLAQIRVVRDAIKKKVEELVEKLHRSSS